MPTLTCRPDPTGPTCVVQEGTGPTIHLPKTDSPESLALALARHGYVLAGSADSPIRAGQSVTLARLPESAHACPSWCASCAAGPPVYRFTTDPCRAVLVHLGPIAHRAGDIAAWQAQLVTMTLLADPPVHGRTGVRIAPTAARLELTADEAERLAARLVELATQCRRSSARTRAKAEPQ